MSQTIQRSAEVPVESAGQRLDRAAASMFPDFSRARLQRWIREGCLTVNGVPRAPRDVVRGGEWLLLDATLEAEQAWQPTPMTLVVVHEDEDLLVIDKPPGLVVHPAAGHADDTLLNGLLARCPELAQLPRAGIVHRLDRDTSGLLVVARTLAAQTGLASAMQARRIRREYRAVVNGVVTAGASIDKPIGRHPRDRQRMAVLHSGGRDAVTHYRVLERYRNHTLLAVMLETGRTHQIRVHLADAGHPVTGDPVYGGRVRLPRAPSAELTACLRGFRRQALHAYRLQLEHPRTGHPLAFEAPLPADMRALVDALATDRSEADEAR